MNVIEGLVRDAIVAQGKRRELGSIAVARPTKTLSDGWSDSPEDTAWRNRVIASCLHGAFTLETGEDLRDVCADERVDESSTQERKAQIVKMMGALGWRTRDVTKRSSGGV